MKPLLFCLLLLISTSVMAANESQAVEKTKSNTIEYWILKTDIKSSSEFINEMLNGAAN